MPIKRIKELLFLGFLYLTTMSNAGATSEQMILAVAQESINCVFNHDKEISEKCIKQQPFDSETAQTINTFYKEDENFKLMQDNMMIMREKQVTKQIKAIESGDSTISKWLVTTHFTLTLVRENIEIQRPMQNSQVIALNLTNTPTAVIEQFTTKVIGDSIIFDHELARKKNCKQDSNFQGN